MLNPKPKPQGIYSWILWSVIFLLIILFICIFIAIAWFNVQKQPQAPQNKTSLDQSKMTTIDNFSNWKTYLNEKYGFEFKYPHDWKISDDDNAVGFKSPEVIEWEEENAKNCEEKSNCHTELPSFNLIFTYMPVQEFRNKIGDDSIDEVKVIFNGIDFINYGIFGCMGPCDNYRTEQNGMMYNFEIIGEEDVAKEVIESFKLLN